MKIAIITDNKRNLDYDRFMTLNDYDLYRSFEEMESNDLDAYQLLLLDVEDRHRILTLGEKIRKRSPGMPILTLTNMTDDYVLAYLKKMPGYGPVKVIKYKDDFEEELLVNIESMLHPDYPRKTKKIAIVLPVYNEEERFQYVLSFAEKLGQLIENAFINASIYFVNDGSKDRSQELVDQLISKQDESSDYVFKTAFWSSHQLQVNTRKAGTYIQGIKGIKSDIILFVDADDSFSIDDIARFINILEEGYYDMVVGTKDFSAENRSTIRKFVSFGKRTLTKRLLPKGVYDSQTGIKAMTGTAANYIIGHLHEEMGLAIDLEILYIAKKMGFRVLQLPVKCIDREGSHVNIVEDSIKFLRSIGRIKRLNKDIK